MATEHNIASQGSSAGRNNCTAAPRLARPFSEAQLSRDNLRQHCVSRTEDIGLFAQPPSNAAEAPRMFQNGRSEAIFATPQHNDEKFYTWDQLYNEPPLMPLPPRPLPDTSRTRPPAYGPNDINPKYRWDYLARPSPTGPPSVASPLTSTPGPPMPASGRRGDDFAASIDCENGRPSRVRASTLLERDFVNIEGPQYGLKEVAKEQITQDQGPANVESYSCKCGKPDSWQSNMVKCMGPRHGDAGWHHLKCADLTMDTIPDDDWYCAECMVGDNDTDSDDEDFPVTGTRGKRLKSTVSDFGPRKKPLRSEPPARIFNTPAISTPSALVSRSAQSSSTPMAPTSIVRNSALSGKFPAAGGGFRAGWTEHERTKMAQVMKEMVEEKHESLGKEQRWDEAARRLKKYRINRTGPGVKNHWNRVGRATSGIDERTIPKPDKMTTGVPKARRERKQPKKEKEERQNEDEKVVVVIDDEDDDDDDNDPANTDTGRPSPFAR